MTMSRYVKNRQAGVAMVEFAIVLPLLLLLMLGVAEIGRAMVRYNALTKAVQAGARYAAGYALLGTTNMVQISATLTNETRNVVVYGNAAGTGSPALQGLSVSQITIAGTGPQQILVTAAYPYQPLIGPVLPRFGLGSSSSMAFTMQASVSMRAL